MWWTRIDRKEKQVAFLEGTSWLIIECKIYVIFMNDEIYIIEYCHCRSHSQQST